MSLHFAQDNQRLHNEIMGLYGEEGGLTIELLIDGIALVKSRVHGSMICFSSKQYRERRRRVVIRCCNKEKVGTINLEAILSAAGIKKLRSENLGCLPLLEVVDFFLARFDEPKRKKV